MRPAILLLCLTTTSFAADRPIWPQWRGPNRDGSSPGSAFPDKLDSLKKSWRVELGPSYSGPIVLADRVIVTETPDGKTEAVRALDRETGKELWSVRWAGGQPVHELARERGTWTRATPASDGTRVFAPGM